MELSRKFTVGFHNIHGMHDSTGCKIAELKNELSSDIEIFAEIWGCNCVLSFENYTVKQVSAQKYLAVKKGRKSGGFTILIKKHLFKSVKILKTSNNYVWIEVDKILLFRNIH